jgi:hypothetical protein
MEGPHAMPKRHANPEYMNRLLLRGQFMVNEAAVKCCKMHSCPTCRAAKGWPCTGITSGKSTPTPHAARWDKWINE